MVYLLEITDIVPIKWEIHHTLNLPHRPHIQVLTTKDELLQSVAASQNLSLFSNTTSPTPENRWLVTYPEILKDAQRNNQFNIDKDTKLIVVSPQYKNLKELSKHFQYAKLIRYKRITLNKALSIITENLNEYSKYYTPDLLKQAILKRFTSNSIPTPALYYTLNEALKHFQMSPKAGVAYLKLLEFQNQNKFDQWQIFDYLFSPNYNTMYAFFTKYLLYNDVYQTIALLKKGVSISILLRSGLPTTTISKHLNTSIFFVQNLQTLLKKYPRVSYDKLVNILQALNNTLFNIRQGKGPQSPHELFLTALVKISLINQQR